MGGLSSFSNSSSSCIDVEVGVFDECEERLRSLFNQALLVFLEEEDNTNRPLPAVLGDGERVDLFKLFVLVREREGFDSVSREGLWESVAEKLGFDCSVSPSLRLVYSKYLDRMEKWAMETSRDVDWDNQESEKKGCHEGLLHELGAGFKGLLQTGSCGKRNRAMGFGCKHIEESGSELRRPRKRLRKSRNDDDDKGVVASCVVLGAEEDGSNLSSKKEGDISEMLKWLTLAARCPHDPSIGEIPHWSEWNEHTGNEWWIQAATAKNSLLAKRELVPTPVNFDRIPSLYSTVRLRHFIRRPNVSEGCFGSCSNGSLVSPTESGSSNCLGTSTALVVYIKPNPGNWNRKVNVGRCFQARVDEWTEPVLDSDTKWLGTCIWPLENKDHTLGDDFIGKGRPDGCSCDILRSGSVECTRFHIAEKRKELKRELGDVFLRWRFNEMGEEVALRWTEREEKRFKEKIISGYKSFWKKAGKKFFRRKKREQLVSYYFNVFVINRRRYQNRVTPREIDSDDEGPFGLVGNGYGRDAVHMFGSGNMICTESRQCNDY